MKREKIIKLQINDKLYNYQYLAPMIIKDNSRAGNIAWDTYPEDYPFTNEPKNRLTKK